jgi:hypothetical protein
VSTPHRLRSSEYGFSVVRGEARYRRLFCQRQSRLAGEPIGIADRPVRLSVPALARASTLWLYGGGTAADSQQVHPLRDRHCLPAGGAKKRLSRRIKRRFGENATTSLRGSPLPEKTFRCHETAYGIWMRWMTRCQKTLQATHRDRPHASVKCWPTTRNTIGPLPCARAFAPNTRTVRGPAKCLLPKALIVRRREKEGLDRS